MFYLCLREKDEIGDIIDVFPGIHKLIIVVDCSQCIDVIVFLIYYSRVILFKKEMCMNLRMKIIK